MGRSSRGPPRGMAKSYAREAKVIAESKQQGGVGGDGYVMQIGRFASVPVVSGTSRYAKKISSVRGGKEFLVPWLYQFRHGCLLIYLDYLACPGKCYAIKTLAVSRDPETLRQQGND